MKVATASNPRLDQRWDQQLSPDTGCVGLPGGWSRAWAWVLVPLTFAVTLLYGQASGACAPPLQPRRGLPGPAPCRSADSALNSLRNPTEAGTGRSFCAGTPAGVGEVSLQRDTSPCGSLHPCFTGTMAGPGLPSHLELSLRAVPGVRPLRGPGGAKVWAWCGRWCPVPGEMAGGVRCLQGPRGPGALRETGTVTFISGGICDVEQALWPWVSQVWPLTSNICPSHDLEPGSLCT